MAAPHVLLFPFPAQGHVNPFLDLAERLSSSGVLCTLLLLSPAHFETYARRPQTELLRFASLDGLPAEAVRKLSAHTTSIDLVEIADARLAPLLRSFIQSHNLGHNIGNNDDDDNDNKKDGDKDNDDNDDGDNNDNDNDNDGDDDDNDGKKMLADRDRDRPPISCLISDSFLPWTLDVAKEARIPRIEMWTSSATSYVMASSVPRLIADGLLPFKQGTHESRLDGFLAGWGARLGHVPIDFLGLQSASHPILETLARAFERGRESERILVNSWAAGLEAAAADAVRRARDVRLSLIGPILGAADNEASARLVSADAQLVDECLRWLDMQGAASVVYVAFGSEGFLARHEVHEIAAALGAAGRPFLWALRDGSAADSLPDNLRPGRLPLDKGLIVPWAPQRRVLAHRSVGAFVSHCGWNSVLESLWNGVPVVACPRLAEQNTNMWLVQRCGVGAAAVDTIMGGAGSMRSSGIVQALQQVLQLNESDTTARLPRQKAAEMAASARAAISPSGTSGQAFQELLHYITTSFTVFLSSSRSGK